MCVSNPLERKITGRRPYFFSSRSAYSFADAAIAAEERNVTTAATPRDDGSIRYFSEEDDDLDEFVKSLEIPSGESGKGGSTSGWSMPAE